MSYLKISVLLLLFPVIFVFSCRESSLTINRIEYTIPDHIDVKAVELKNRFSEFKTDPSSPVYIVIVLYSYSSGAETISFSGGQDMSTAIAGGRLKALVKVMNAEELIKAEFVEGRGDTKEDMIISFVKEIKLRLMK